MPCSSPTPHRPRAGTLAGALVADPDDGSNDTCSINTWTTTRTKKQGR
ncbi:hypothetical protein ACI2K4_18950 [Micromonospora sp. NPDC050397]